MSCCGHGGSWFGNCGNVGNANFGHTWYEGIRVCKTRESQASVEQQLYALESKSNGLFDHASIGMNSKEVVVATRMFASTPATTSEPIPIKSVTNNTSIIAPVRASIVHSTGATFSKIVATINTTIMHTAVNISTPKRINSPVIRTIVHQSNQSISQSMAIASAGMFTPANASTRMRDCGKLSHVVTCVNIIFIIVCWY